MQAEPRAFLNSKYFGEVQHANGIVEVMTLKDLEYMRKHIPDSHIVVKDTIVKEDTVVYAITQDFEYCLVDRR